MEHQTRAWRARAEEAERLAAIVSYGRDKERLLAQAADLRQQAESAEAKAAVASPNPAKASLLGRIRTWLDRRRGA